MKHFESIDTNSHRLGLRLCTLEGEPRILKGSGTCRKDQIQEGSIQIKCQINEFDYGKFDVSLAGRLAAGIDQVNKRNSNLIYNY